jgi:hypothetical protein
MGPDNAPGGRHGNPICGLGLHAYAFALVGRAGLEPARLLLFPIGLRLFILGNDCTRRLLRLWITSVYQFRHRPMYCRDLVGHPGYSLLFIFTHLSSHSSIISGPILSASDQLPPKDIPCFIVRGLVGSYPIYLNPLISQSHNPVRIRASCRPPAGYP